MHLHWANSSKCKMFTGNVLIVGRTGCGKTYFMQKLAVNTFFGKLKRVEWVSYSDLDEKR